MVNHCRQYLPVNTKIRGETLDRGNITIVSKYLLKNSDQLQRKKGKWNRRETHTLHFKSNAQGQLHQDIAAAGVLCVRYPERCAPPPGLSLPNTQTTVPPWEASGKLTLWIFYQITDKCFSKERTNRLLKTREKITRETIMVWRGQRNNNAMRDHVSR